MLRNGPGMHNNNVLCKDTHNLLVCMHVQSSAVTMTEPSALGHINVHQGDQLTSTDKNILWHNDVTGSIL